MRSPALAAVGLALLVPVSGAAPALAQAGSYESRLAEADALAAKGRWDASAEVAAALARDFPEDAVAHVRHGYALLNSGRLASAREAYETARRLAPENRDALAGLAAAGRSWFVAPAVHGIGQAWAEHPSRRWAAGTVASIEAGAADRLRLAGVYRFLHVGAIERRDDVQQHEAWAWAGWQERRWGVSLFGAYTHWAPVRRSGSGAAAAATASIWSPDAGAVGGVARVTAWADLVASVAHSLYDDFGVTQVTLDAWLPVLGWLAVRGGGEVQAGNGTAWASGVATLRFHGAAWSLDVGGRFGPRARPLDLEQSSMYNLESDRLDFGARVAATFPIAGPVKGQAAYDLEGIRSPPDAAGRVPETVSTAHRVTIGVAAGF